MVILDLNHLTRMRRFNIKFFTFLLVFLLLQTKAQNIDFYEDQYYKYYNNGGFNNTIKYSLKILEIQRKV